MISSCIFDLDGVLVDTATYHFNTWKKLSHKLGFTIEDSLEERLKGVSRMDSLEIVLGEGGYKADPTEMKRLAALKNEWYLENIEEMGPEEILPGVINFLEDLKTRDISMAVGSASKNAKTIISKIGIGHYFETVIDGLMVDRTKPDPEVFLKAAAALEARPAQSVVFEDSFKGIEAALAGGFLTVGVGKKENLGRAHHVISGFDGLRFSDIDTALDHLHN